MARTLLKDELMAMVKEHGFDQVERQLKQLATTERTTSGEFSTGSPSRAKTIQSKPRSRPKPTPSEYVSKLEIPIEKKRGVSELAARFEKKTFLPSFGDIVSFCHSHGVDVPLSRTRANAVPRVFKLLVTLEADEIQRILDERHFSGPSRLGPISDAIRRSGRSAARSRAKKR